MKFIKTSSIFIFLFLLCGTKLFAQSGTVEIFVTKPGIDCINGEKIALSDINSDNSYDRITKYFCDNGYKDFDLEVNSSAKLDNTMSCTLKRGIFSELDMILEIYDSQGAVVAVVLPHMLRNTYTLYFIDHSEPVNKNLLLISPNPAVDFIDIERRENESTILKISDETGKDVSSQIKIVSDNYLKVRINITNLIHGVYLVQLGKITGKFIKY